MEKLIFKYLLIFFADFFDRSKEIILGEKYSMEGKASWNF